MLKCSMHITKSACSSFFPFLALSSVLIHLWLALLLCGCAKALSFHFYTTIIIWCALSVNCSVRLGRAWRWRHIYFIIPKQHPIHNSTESSSTHTHTRLYCLLLSHTLLVIEFFQPFSPYISLLPHTLTLPLPQREY